MQSFKKRISSRTKKIFLVIAFKLIPDITSLFIAALIAYNYRFENNRKGQIKISPFGDLNYQAVILFLICIWILMLYGHDNYQARHTSIFIYNFRSSLRPSLTLFLGIGFFSYLTKAEFSRSIFIWFFLVGVTSIVFVRYVVYKVLIKLLVSTKRIFTGILMIGPNNSSLNTYTDWLVESNPMGYKIISRLICTKIDLEWLERFDDLVKNKKVEEVLLLPGIDVDINFSKFVHYLHDLNLPINWIPNETGNLGYWQIPTPQEGLPFLTFKEPKISSIGRFFKRLFDLMFSFIFLIVFSPLFFIIALLIITKDGRPVFFAQERIGRNGKSFKIFKFRTMVKNAEDLLKDIENKHGRGHILFKNNDDPRVTEIGKLLRRYSLDELPQFVNSFLGSISIVGPRPALPRETAVYSSLYERRLRVKPGITGPWQISGRSDLDLKTSVALDLNYVSNWSFSRDLLIILSTPVAVLRKKGAY
jgi:exopolysaccharide biosynthesis polyprenyl glycosylphosphotransferase